MKQGLYPGSVGRPAASMAFLLFTCHGAALAMAPEQGWAVVGARLQKNTGFIAAQIATRMQLSGDAGGRSLPTRVSVSYPMSLLFQSGTVRFTQTLGNWQKP